MISKEEAHKLTEKIRDNINQSAKLIQKAHEGKIWLALEMTSFAEWLYKAVGVSRARGYQLLNIANTEEQIRALLDPMPEYFILSDRDTRLIARHELDNVLEEISKRKKEDNLASTEHNHMMLLIEVLDDLESEEILAKREAETGERYSESPEKPVDHNAYAENFYKAFSMSISDLPDIEETEADDYQQIMDDLAQTLSIIDNTLAAYEEAE